jgi:hypothetical protein
MPRLGLPAAAAVLLAGACSCSSGGSGTPGGGDDGGSGGSSSGSASGSGGGGSGSSSGGSDAGGSSGGSSGGGDAGASSGGDGGGAGKDKLFPLAVGYSWTYDVQNVGAGSACSAGTWNQAITGTRTVDGRSAFDLTSFCSAAGQSEVAPAGTGDEIDIDFQGSWLKLIDGTLVEGETWTYFNASYTWHRETSVSVPYGTFTDCWTANQNVSYTAYQTYCRGVGMVRSYSSDLNGAGWDAKLTDKSF